MIKTLIVEDEFLVRMGLKTIIDWPQYGFQIVGEATNGEDGLELYLKHRPALIITDIKMPKMDGLALMTAIRKLDRNAHFIVLTAYADFSYARSAIGLQVDGYLLKGTMTNEELTGILEKVTASMPESSVSPCDTNSLPSLKKLLTDDSTIAEVCPFSLEENDTVYVACVRIAGSKNPVINESFHSLCRNLLAEKKWEYTEFEDDNYFCILLTSSQDPLSVMGLLSDTIKRYLGRQLFCGASHPAKSTNHIASYIAQAKTACDANILSPEKGFIQIYTPAHHSRSEKVDNLLLALNQALLEQDPENCMQLLDRLMPALQSAGSLKLLNRSMYHIVIILTQYDDSLSETEIIRSLLELDQLDLVFQEIKCRFVEMCKTLPQLLPRNDGYIESAKLFIRNNISQNIKLRDIAEYLHLSSNYLGKLFFSSTGTHLTDFIISEKISAACRLIQETDLLVGEIAQQVGLNDQQYFSKLFKKKTGYTPKEYARLHGQQ